MTTLLALVQEGLPKNRTGVCLATRRDGAWIRTSPDELARMVDEVALGLRTLGVDRGDRVALHAESCTEWVAADQAILSLGAVSVPIYTTQPAEQVEYILDDAAAKAYVVSTEALYRSVAPVLGRVPSLRACVGIRGRYGADVLSWDEVRELGREAAEREPGFLDEARARVRPDDLATLIYTSGTTGTPKGVMLTHHNLASNALASEERMPWDVEGERGKAILSYLPLSHVFERMLSYLYLHIGYPVWFVESPDQILEDLQTVQPVHFSSVPRLLEKVYHGVHDRVETMQGAQRKVLAWGLALADRFDVERPLSLAERVQYALADALVYRKLRDRFGGNLQAITSGGAALSAEVMNFMNAIGIFCGQGYGLTETSPVIAVYTKGELRAGSVGTPLRDVEVRIADDGEILARGPNVMRGYYHQPEATAQAFTEDGWFRTGDVGHLDDNGFLFVTDRKKELLKLSTGKYVAPQPIEARLAAGHVVEQAVVIGNGMKFVSALIVLDRTAAAGCVRHAGRRHGGDDALLCDDPAVREAVQREVDAVNRDLPPWEQVKKFVLLTRPWTVETGELTPTLKIKRRVVQEKHGAEIQSMYA